MKQKDLQCILMINDWKFQYAQASFKQSVILLVLVHRKKNKLALGAISESAFSLQMQLKFVTSTTIR